MNHETNDTEPGFFRRHGVLAAVLVVAAGGVFAVVKMLSGSDKPVAKKAYEPPMIRVAPTPPPPPPPPPKPPEPKPETEPRPDEPKMIEQEPVATNEAKPVEKSAEPPPAPDSAPMGSNIRGDGPPDGFGLVGGGGGGSIGGTGTGNTAGAGGAGGVGSRWGWYASQVQTQIVRALGKNQKTRSAALRIKVRVWPDVTGRITRAELSESTGDAELDAAVRDEVLVGLTLSEPPPEGMPSPIVMRISGRRP